MLAWLTFKLTEKESQKIDDLPVLATRWSGTSAMLSSKVRSRFSWKHSVMPAGPAATVRPVRPWPYRFFEEEKMASRLNSNLKLAL